MISALSTEVAMRNRLKKMAASLAAGPFAEPLMGLTMVMVGVALALPTETFLISAYGTMGLIAPEPAWALVFAIVGMAQMTAALLEVRHARLASAMLGGVLWVIWTAATLHSGYRGVLWAIGIAMVLGQALAYLRAKAMA